MTTKVQFEYQVVSLPSNDPTVLTQSLNGFGADGWEVINVEPQAGSSQIVYLKRVKS